MNILRDRNFRIFWAGQTVSWLGGWMQSVAQGWLVWSLTRSPSQLALTAIMVSLPALLFSLAGGVSADRFSKRTILITTQGASLLPSCLLGGLTICGQITPSRLLALAFLQGALNSFDVPARQAFLSELVPRERLPQAIALNSVSFNATRMLGPALAGCIIAAWGTAPCFFLNAASFAVGVASLLSVRGAAARQEEGRGSGVLDFPPEEVRGELLCVLKDGEIRRLLLSVAAVSLFGIPFVPLLPVFAEVLKVGARGLGGLSACAGGGSLLAALALTRSKHDGNTPGLAAGIVFAAALLAFARSEDYRLSLLALVAVGGGMVVFLARVNSFLQSASPWSLRGRVMGAYTFALLGMAPVGSALMGTLASRVGAAGALTFSASACLISLLLISIPFRKLLPGLMPVTSPSLLRQGLFSYPASTAKTARLPENGVALDS